MCGILGCYVKEGEPKEQFKVLFDTFKQQSSRGMQGAGVSILNNDKGIQIRKRENNPYCLFSSYYSKLWDNMKKDSLVLFHHRFPTSTPNEPKFNHPICNEDKSIHLIHNGHISNYVELCNELFKEGHEFETYKHSESIVTDTEVLVHLIENSKEKHGLDWYKICKDLEEKAHGCYAIAVTFKEENKIYLFANDNPIELSYDIEGNTFFSSEFHKESGLIYYRTLEDGETGIIDKSGYENVGVVHGVNYRINQELEAEEKRQDKAMQRIRDIEKPIIKKAYDGSEIDVCDYISCKECVNVDKCKNPKHTTFNEYVAISTKKKPLSMDLSDYQALKQLFNPKPTSITGSVRTVLNHYIESLFINNLENLLIEGLTNTVDINKIFKFTSIFMRGRHELKEVNLNNQNTRKKLVSFLINKINYLGYSCKTNYKNLRIKDNKKELVGLRTPTDEQYLNSKHAYQMLEVNKR